MADEDFVEEPIVYEVSVDTITNIETSWYRVMSFCFHNNVEIVPYIDRFYSALIFPSKSVYLEFINEFPELLTGK